MTIKRQSSEAWRIGILALVLATICAPIWSQTTVQLCDSQNPPYSDGKEDGSVTNQGLAVALAEAVFDRIDNTEVEVRLMPWSRCLQAARSGKMDGVLKLLETDERKEFLEFTKEPIYLMDMVFFYTPERFPDGVSWETLADLSEYRIGLTEGSSYGEAIDGAVKDGILKADRVTADAQNVHKLLAGRIDLFPNDKIMGLAAIHGEGMDGKILVSEQSVSSAIIRIGVSKKSPHLALLTEIDRVLKELRESGEADRILAGGK